MLRSTSDLLTELDPLPFPRRMEVLAARSGDLPGLAEDLAGGDAYERLLAVTVASMTGERDVILGALEDPDVVVRSTALKAALRAGWLGGDDLTELLADAPADLRRLVHRSLRLMRLPAVADAVIDSVRARYGDGEAAVLLAACGSGTVRRLLPLVAYREISWKGIARRHGDVVLDFAASALAAAAPPDRARVWADLGPGIFAAARFRPETVLDLLERFAPAGELPGTAGDLRYLGVLSAVAPQRVIRLLAAPGRAQWLGRVTLPAAVLDRIRNVDQAELVPLGRPLRDRPWQLAHLLKSLPPARRGPLYEAVSLPKPGPTVGGVVSLPKPGPTVGGVVPADGDTAGQMPDGAVMDVLPREWRYREARRVLQLPWVRSSEAETVTWSVYLPWSEVVPSVAGLMRSANPVERARAWSVLGLAARLANDPEAAADLVARLSRLRNEQSPVRAAGLGGLSGLARLLRADSAEALDHLVTGAVQARDASTDSFLELGYLAIAVLTHHDDPQLVKWALHTLDRLPTLPHLGELRRGQESLVFARLRDWIVADLDRGSFDRLFAVTRALGRRARNVPELQELLGRAVDPGNTTAVLRTAIELWLDDPRTRDDRVQRVLDADPSAAVIDRVWKTICARRTDLLDRVLVTPPPTGQFLSKNTRWVPDRPHYVRRWLPRQWQAFAARQAAIVADRRTPDWTRAAALTAAESVPDFGRRLQLGYVDWPDTVLAEAALGGLSRTDRPQEALPILLAHAGDDQARVAMYAASRAIRFTRPSRVLSELREIALGAGKVTSRKEAIRLLARYGPPTAMEVLAEIWAQPDGHRDVRAAVVSGARERLDSPTAWTILTQAASGSRAEITGVLAAAPSRLSEPNRRRYATLIITACAGTDRVVSRAAWASLARWVRWAPDVTDLTVAALADPANAESPRHSAWPGLAELVGALLDHPPRPTPPSAGATPPQGRATSGSVQAAGPGAPDTVLAATLRELIRHDAEDRQPGGPAADRPARRRVRVVARAAASWARRADPAADRTPVRRAALALAGNPRFIPDAAELLTAALDPAATTLRDDVQDIVTLLADRPVLAARLAETFAAAIAVPDPAVLLPLARELAARPDPAAGFFALACVRPGATSDWTAPWRDQLEQLRAHPSPEVADAAMEVQMAVD